MEYNNERFVNDINPEFAIEFHQKGGNILHYSGAKLLDQDIYYKRAQIIIDRRKLRRLISYFKNLI